MACQAITSSFYPYGNSMSFPFPALIASISPTSGSAQCALPGTRVTLLGVTVNRHPAPGISKQLLRLCYYNFQVVATLMFATNSSDYQLILLLLRLC